MPYSRSATSGPARGNGEALWRTLSGQSQISELDRQRSLYDAGIDTHTGEEKNEQPWDMASEVDSWYEDLKADNLRPGALGVTFKGLSVYGVGAGTAIHENSFSQFNVPTKIRESRAAKASGERKVILDQVHGCVKPGEMLLVLGRPGAGCTTLLNMLANRRHGYDKIEGDINWGSMDHKRAQKYRGQIIMNSEEEIFFPTLTVGQTMDFATRLNVPTHRPTKHQKPQDYQKTVRDFLLRSMGISHTDDTKVGDAYVRGVSGGERKRVSIIEVLAQQGSVYCWDNSTRGLDASTALEWTKAIRAMTDILGLTTVVTLYQAGNSIFNLFDKVLVLDEGREIYYGPRAEARPFMEAQGFICDDAANVGDFLTGVTVPTERAIRPECERSFPKSAQALEEIYMKSDIKKQVECEYDYPTWDETKTTTSNFENAVVLSKASKQHPTTVPFLTQVSICITRQYQMIWGDKMTLFIKQVSTLIQALVAGSLFYNAPDNSAGLFVKGGAIFLGLLYNALVAMTETTDSFTGRPVLAKHKEFAMYHPAAFCIAQITADFPLLFIQVTVFSVVLYFMVGLKATAAAFFTFWFFLYVTSIVMTAFFRLCGAAFSTFDAASKVSGFAVATIATYAGYQIPKPQMHPWFVWIYWINPMAYGFESLLANEFHDTIINCVATNLVPFGEGYNDPTYSACTGISGAPRGSSSFSGDDYLASLSYSNSHKWRNIGVLWAWWALFAGLTIFFTNRWKQESSGGVSLIPREKVKVAKEAQHRDEESHMQEKTPAYQASITNKEGNTNENKSGNELVRNTSVFTWKNLCYTVSTPSGPRQLLNDVQGWVKPGTLGALMGSSGAGKTTLMDVLAQRKTEGSINGEILVDGRPLPVSFQRSAGYCEQLDVHEPFATVREALEFSALLRQSRDTPDAEKLAYVDTVIDLLELHDLEHSLIGRVGAGLSVEQRKRVTIGVELVAKPSILIFLDEPTSGLDGQAAFNTLRFLKKLAAAGQAVLCTIHQPSAQLFAQFDTLLLLTKGGKTVYFGDVGDDSATIKDYFARNGAPCPSAANPAEHMIDVVSGSLSKGRDWNKVWLESPEHAAVVKHLDHIVADAANKPPGTTDDGHEFATAYWTQIKLVTQRMNTSLFRNTDYVMNKVFLHIGSALFNGFTFWMIGHSVADLHNILFTVFNFIFVAPGVIAQLQPLFIERRDIFETREKKSKMYHWAPFVTGLIVSELPYLVICAVLYFVCWYYTAGLPHDSSRAGSVFFVMLMYEFLYTGIGQSVAAYAPSAVFASLINPLWISVLVSFCGVLVPYTQIQPFWRYWLYYLNPFTYLIGSLMVFTTYDRPVTCKTSELAVFNTPNNGQTCADYLSAYLSSSAGSAANLLNPQATSGCEVCQYATGSQYLATLNLTEYSNGWRDAGICVLFVISSYALVYVLMKLRTKASKKAE